MNVNGINDFDIVIKKAVREMEAKHNCWVFILNDETDWYMSIYYFDEKEMVKDIKLNPLGESKYKLATAIRKYFRA